MKFQIEYFVVLIRITNSHMFQFFEKLNIMFVIM